MPILSTPQYRVPIGYVLDDGRTVLADRPFFDYLSDLFSRVGGAIAPSNSELVVDMHDDAGIEELKDDVMRSRDALNQAPPGAFFIVPADEYTRLHAVEADLEALRLRLSALEQGSLL